MDQDNKYREYFIESVEESEDEGTNVKFDDGWFFHLPPHPSYKPQVGDLMRLYGDGIGYPIRGAVVNGRIFFYHTQDEWEAKQKEQRAARKQRERTEYISKRASFDERIAKLPQEFQDRIHAFRAYNDEWGQNFEAYELMVCEDAAYVAEQLCLPERVVTVAKLGWEDQKEYIPDVSDGHSGNSFGAMMRLAWLYLTDASLIPQEHGALCPLTGCEEYGCYAARVREDANE